MSKHARFAAISLCVMTILPFTLALVELAGQEKKPAKKLKRTEVDLGGGAKMKFVFIEPGKFMMGSPKEEKEREPFAKGSELQHEVKITKGFWMGVYEVTQEEYEKVIGKNPSNFIRGKGKRWPVQSVTWGDAMEFAKQLSKKAGKTIDLPTEAEWEYACRAGSKEAFHYGNSLSSKQANFDGNSPYGGAAKGRWFQTTVPVGPYAPNAYGLYDMHGNVLEWCKDWYGVAYYKDSPLRDPQGPKKGDKGADSERVVRGGSWINPASACRSVRRVGAFPDDISVLGTIGFRVVGRFP